MQHNIEKYTDFSENSTAVVVPERLVHGGAALVRTSAGVAFVEGALPNERIRIGPVFREGGTPRADLLEILEPSPHRRRAECPLFGDCGGCDWQHLDYAQQLHWKREILAENFRRLGSVDIPIEEIGMIAGTEYGYRSRVQVHATGNGGVGFRRRHSHETIPVSHCPVATPAINGVLDSCNGPASEHPRRLPRPRTVLVEEDSGVAVEGVHRKATITLDGRPFTFDPAGFAQANQALLPEVATRLRDAYLGGPLVDLYAGAGLLTALILAGSPSRATSPEPTVICVEPDRRNTHHIRKNLAVRGYTDAVQVVAAPAERAIMRAPLRELGADHTTVVVDPPRGGLSKAVSRWLVGAPAKGAAAERVIYVSCDAAALARDVGRLSAAYAVRETTLVDFYPQTAHLEAVVILERRKSPPV